MTFETFESRAFLVAWIALVETGKKKAGRDGPRSGAAYTEGGQKRQGDGFPGAKNRCSKINGLSMWFYDTTIFRTKYEAANAKSSAGARRDCPNSRPTAFLFSLVMGNKTHLVSANWNSGARQTGLETAPGRLKSCRDGRVSCATHRACRSLDVYPRLYVRTDGGVGVERAKSMLF
ncbi:hypothetical protein NOJ28_19225 [Neorhizobium galegae]|uniref:hypothetical protein n=1 Tax=Neorhizobium galegae TaxID=399 RepID=UPI0021041E8D|nr:hypothetical protein [Neorhizobium galegae]MCQ1767680.1 hypothetical protein [Neorhizobium galegae]MCQ1848019.1 hypothetical protein [Neorhizobium galegae]